MVESASTTSSENSNTGVGGTTDFSSRLDATTLAAVGDPTTEQGGIEKLSDSDKIDQYNLELAQDIVSQFPTAITLKQAECLAKSYYTDHFALTSEVIKQLKTDGVLVPTSGVGGWYFNCSKVSGIKLAYALWNAADMKDASPITAAQFDNFTDILFGDIGGVSPQTAAFLTSAFGTGGKLSLNEVAAIFDSGSIGLSIAKEIGDYVKVGVHFGAVPLRSDTPTTAAFLMCYDQNNDGLLNFQELRSNNQERRLNFANGEDPVPTYLACYGKKDANGTMVLDMDAVKAMLTDGSLGLSANADSWDAPFATNLKAIPIERVISGASYGDGGSLNDGILSNGELVTLFGKLGQNVTSKQAQFLINVYGDGTSMTTANVQQMRNDGFLTTGSFVSDKATLNWDNIDGGLIADAMYRAVGVAAGTGLTADQFDTATDTLFGDYAGVNLQQAAFLTRIFGTDNTLNGAQMAGIFEKNIISINGVGGENYIRIAVKTPNDNLLFTDNATAANYIAMFDTNYDGWLDAGELKTAINSRTSDGVSADDKITQNYMNCYGEKASGGYMLISRDGVMAMLADTSLKLMSVAPNRGYAVGFDINLNAIPTARLLRGQSYGYVSGVLLARAIIKQVGLDPDTAGVALKADQFSTGFNLLYSGMQVKPLKDPAGLTKYFGSNDTLTVAQMGDALNALNTNVSIPLVANPKAGGFNEEAMVPAWHTTGFWGSIIGAADAVVEGGVVAVVSTVAKISGITTDIVAGVLNGSMDLAAAIANEGSTIVPAIIKAIKNGDESAKGLLENIGKAINHAISDLSAEGKTLISEMVDAAKEVGEDMAVQTLAALAGMSAADAKKQIEALASKGKVAKFCTEANFETMTALIPGFVDKMTDMEKQYDAAMSNFGQSDADRQALAAKGYTFNSENKLMKSGKILSESETQIAYQDVYGKIDLGIDLGWSNMGLGNLDGFELRATLCYTGKINGTDKNNFQIRFRVLDLAGIGGKIGRYGADTGLSSAHEYALTWAVEKGWKSATKTDTRYNSSLVYIGEAKGARAIAAVLGEAIAGDAPQPPATWTGPELEIGGGGGMTVTYNLSQLGKKWWQPMLSEVAGAAIGAGLTYAVMYGVVMVTRGAFKPFVDVYGGTLAHAGAMAGGFAADLIYAHKDPNAEHASVSSGFFFWIALKSGGPSATNLEGGKGQSVVLQQRTQISSGSDPWLLM